MKLFFIRISLNRNFITKKTKKIYIRIKYKSLENEFKKTYNGKYNFDVN